ncbi:putative reverse transcriptase domain-containing protein [Tanacetum coccineum]
MNERCSAVLLNKLPSKEKDPRSFTIPCDIGQLHINNALADLGASISLMPYMMYEKLGLGEPKATRMSLEHADRSIQYPRGIIENVLIKVDKFVLPIDFVILDMSEDSRVPIILGRPFLVTARAMIDVFNKKITLRVGDDEETAKPIKVEREHLYLASANEIDEKKPELKDLPHHLEYAYLHANLDRMLARCEETNLVLNWEKCHFMVKEGIVLGHKIPGIGLIWGCDILVIRAKVIENQIMAASAIAISSDSSDESVGSPPSRVILFGDIPTVIPSTFVVAPETSTFAPVISSAALVVEKTLHISPLPAISPFLCTDSSEAPDFSDGPPSQDSYVMVVSCWRSKVASRPSSSSEFPIAPVRDFGPLPARRLAWRCVSPRSSDHRPSSSSLSSDSSPVYSSSLDAADQAHSGFSTRDVPPRLCYPQRRAPRRSEAFCRWCAAPLSTLYPPTTSNSSSGDSSERPLHSSSHSAGPSRKRCRSSVDFVPSSTPVMGSLAQLHADLLHLEGSGDSYSSKASIEEDTEIDPIETEVDMELGIGDSGNDLEIMYKIDPGKSCKTREEYEWLTQSAGDTVEVGIDLMLAPIVEEENVEPAGEDSSDSSGTRDGIVRSFEDMPIDLDDVVHDFYHHMSEVRIDRIVRIKTVQRRLEAD